MNDTNPWASDHERYCMNRYTRNRYDQTAFNIKGDVTGLLLRNFSDILIGHLPLGVHQYWMDQENNTVRPQYVAFFRDPVAKYVSGRLFTNRDANWNFTTAIQQIKAEVLAQRQSGSYYFGIDKYLTSPEQKGLTRSMEERVEIVRHNLLSYNCIVGVVERMRDSLSLIQHVIDGKMEMTERLRRLDNSKSSSSNPGHSNTTGVTVNKSHLSTTALVAELQNDDAFYSMLLDYLRYEFLVYDYALQIHAKQVATLYEQYGDRYRISERS